MTMILHLERHCSCIQSGRDILAGEALAPLEFYAPDRDTSRGPPAPDKQNAPDRYPHRLLMPVKVVRQGSDIEGVPNLSGSLKIQRRMNMFVTTGVHHRRQFAPHLT